MLFAWKVAKYVKSNAIVYAKDSRTIGVGLGQISRINTALIVAIKAERAGLVIPGSVMSSNELFPFTDCIEAAVIQPGGSQCVLLR